MSSTFVAGLILLIDQAVKEGVREALTVCTGPPVESCERFVLVGSIRLLRLENAGSVLGFLQGEFLWVLLATLGLLLLPLYHRRLAGAGLIATLAIGLQTGGALGNMTDRLFRGSVTDFIDVGIGVAFNFADVALVAGMFLAFEALRRSVRRRVHWKQVGESRKASDGVRADV